MANRGIDTCIGRMKAAASLGYNGFIISNWDDNTLESVSQQYKNNVSRAMAEAKRLKIAIIPRHFYQGDAVYDNYNLAEAFPVRGTKFKVVGGEARSVQDHETGFKNGGFESGTTGWNLINMPGSGVQNGGAKSGNACLRISGANAYARIKQGGIKLKPYRAYRLSVWAKTQGFTGWADARFAVMGSGSLLHKRYRPFGTPVNEMSRGTWTTLSINHGWVKSQTDFNSLNSTTASVEFLASRPGKAPVGTIWLDDIKLEEVGLFETVRRKNCPIIVKSMDGSKTYKEGTDYTVDPQCDVFTKEDWWYQGHLKIPAGSSIKNGQELRVSWYQMADVEQIAPEANYCLTETRDALRDNVRRMDNIYGDSSYMFVGFDEWRTAFWDDRCELFPKARTAGEYMASALKLSTDIAWTGNNCRELIMWNDMYDPYFNAWKPYGMTNGGCLESWKNMDTNIVIMNWRPGPKWDRMSLRFFMGVDDSLNPEKKVWRQILSVMGGARVGGWLNMVDQAEKEGGRGVIGISYVSWGAGYGQMAAVKNACVARGRWSSGPLPKGICTTPPSINPQLDAKAISSQLSATNISNRNIGISYTLARNSRVDFSIVDAAGREIETLVAKKQAAGRHGISWDISSIPSGVYFLRLMVDGSQRQTLKHIVF